jgi:hypothetical protein
LQSGDALLAERLVSKDSIAKVEEQF